MMDEVPVASPNPKLYPDLVFLVVRYANPYVKFQAYRVMEYRRHFFRFSYYSCLSTTKHPRGYQSWMHPQLKRFHP